MTADVRQGRSVWGHHRLGLVPRECGPVDRERTYVLCGGKWYDYATFPAGPPLAERPAPYAPWGWWRY